MSLTLPAWLPAVDAIAAACLFPAALAILASGLEDLALDLYCMWCWASGAYTRLRGSMQPSPAGPNERAVAIFVPLWHEAGVIAGMVEHNLSAIDYGNYHIFVGGYPNDEATLEAVRDLESRFPHVHLAVCPHDGPTSKADCLNWIYQSMLLFEEHHGLRFELMVTHDAEDLIHPHALACLNSCAGEYDMIQIPVLPLPTPLRNLVHGIYCDEFAEWQRKDMPARQIMGSFVPSNGVGTGFSRAAIEKLASAEHNLIFEPACLTEDYENGLRLHKLGCRQTFVPLAGRGAGMMATREYFPRTLHAAIRQRTRWIMGIGLQSWERHGWRGTPAQVYWFWRDRKGLFGNPLSLLANLLFAYGALSWAAAWLTGSAWTFGSRSLHPGLLLCTLLLQVARTGVRMVFCAGVYGPAFALGVPLRSVVANWINAVATVNAIGGYLHARLRRRPLVWLKTEHAYPSRNALMGHKRKLGEILAGSGYLSQADLERALADRPAGVRLGEFLVRRGAISEDELYEALSLQHSLPSERLDPDRVSTRVARALPRHIIRQWRVLPFRIAAGSMYVASPEIPTDELGRALRGYTRLEPRFHLITPGNFEELAAHLL